MNLETKDSNSEKQVQQSKSIRTKFAIENSYLFSRIRHFYGRYLMLNISEAYSMCSADWQLIRWISKKQLAKHIQKIKFSGIPIWEVKFYLETSVYKDQVWSLNLDRDLLLFEGQATPSTNISEEAIMNGNHVTEEHTVTEAGVNENALTEDYFPIRTAELSAANFPELIMHADRVIDKNVVGEVRVNENLVLANEDHHLIETAASLATNELAAVIMKTDHVTDENIFRDDRVNKNIRLERKDYLPFGTTVASANDILDAIIMNDHHMTDENIDRKDSVEGKILVEMEDCTSMRTVSSVTGALEATIMNVNLVADENIAIKDRVDENILRKMKNYHPIGATVSSATSTKDDVTEKDISRGNECIKNMLIQIKHHLEIGISDLSATDVRQAAILNEDHVSERINDIADENSLIKMGFLHTGISVSPVASVPDEAISGEDHVTDEDNVYVLDAAFLDEDHVTGEDNTEEDKNFILGDIFPIEISTVLDNNVLEAAISNDVHAIEGFVNIADEIELIETDFLQTGISNVLANNVLEVAILKDAYAIEGYFNTADETELIETSFRQTGISSVLTNNVVEVAILNDVQANEGFGNIADETELIETNFRQTGTSSVLTDNVLEAAILNDAQATYRFVNRADKTELIETSFRQTGISSVLANNVLEVAILNDAQATEGFVNIADETELIETSFRQTGISVSQQTNVLEEDIFDGNRMTKANTDEEYLLQETWYTFPIEIPISSVGNTQKATILNNEYVSNTAVSTSDEEEMIEMDFFPTGISLSPHSSIHEAAIWDEDRVADKIYNLVEVARHILPIEIPISSVCNALQAAILKKEYVTNRVVDTSDNNEPIEMNFLPTGISVPLNPNVQEAAILDQDRVASEDNPEEDENLLQETKDVSQIAVSVLPSTNDRETVVQSVLIDADKSGGDESSSVVVKVFHPISVSSATEVAILNCDPVTQATEVVDYVMLEVEAKSWITVFFQSLMYFITCGCVGEWCY